MFMLLICVAIAGAIALYAMQRRERRSRALGNIRWVYQDRHARNPWALRIVIETLEGGEKAYNLALHADTLPDGYEFCFIHNVKDSRDFAKQAARWVNGLGFAVTDSDFENLKKSIEGIDS